MFPSHPVGSLRLRLHCALILLLCLAGWLGSIVPEAQADLFVSSFLTDEVKRYNGTTGAFIDNFASGGGLDGPSGLVFGPDGNLYVISGVTSEVKRYNGTTGAFIGNFTSGGGIGTPISLVFGPDGNLYVGSFNLRVNRYNGTTGIFIDAIAIGDVDEAFGVEFGPDGNLYVSSSFVDKVQRFNGTTGAFINTFVSAGSGGLSSPGALLFGPDGNLYVSSAGTDQVKRYDGTTGAFIDNFASGGGLDGPGGLAFTREAVPEPATLALLALGLAALAWGRRRRGPEE